MSDILKLVKAVNEKCQSKDGSIDHRYWAFRSVELLPELIAEIERLQGLIDKPPEEADWVADYHLLQSALDGPIIDAARKWHAAYRKAQNSNLMRTKEVKRLRSKLEEYQIKYGVDIASTDLHWQDEIAAKDTRIKELEAAVVDGRAQYLLLLDCNKDCTAWNFDELFEEDQNTLRRLAWISLKMEEPWVYVQLREAREQVKLLEAAFLKAEKANLMHHMDADYADENAREALERIKEGGKDMPS